MKNTSAMTRRELIAYVTGLKAMIAQLQAEIRKLTAPSGQGLQGLDAFAADIEEDWRSERLKR